MLDVGSPTISSLLILFFFPKPLYRVFTPVGASWWVGDCVLDWGRLEAQDMMELGGVKEKIKAPLFKGGGSGLPREEIG